jgi:hypothetical protein
VADLATYSRTNGWIAAGAAAGLFLLVVLEGYDGNSALAGWWGFLGLSIGLQALDDLVWEGSQDPLVRRLRFGGVILAVACLAVALVSML